MRPLKRLERTQQLLATYCAERGRGIDAAELAEGLGASRHNVSADLNELWRAGLVVKLPGRPVLFWDRETYQRLEDAPGAGTSAGAAPVAPAADPLAALIGAHESLRGQVEQAKAAVLYPPFGLHTLLVGPTGVGKSHLAELMHAFGVAAGRFPKGAPFVTLNCADYANNPQLLMAHLFGAAKGAYTGADKERDGLVDHADGGVLFLDEVHRLPAEGQEMLFRLIDLGLYRRLGEAGPERHARIMLIAATTERIDSALLRTFTRRIPMVIALPALAERTAVERFRFLRRFLRAEAGKIGVDIVVPQAALQMLLEYDCLGNIGQLKNDVQLACARLFLSYLSQRREPMELLAMHLPEHIHRALPPARQRDPEIHGLLVATGDQLWISKTAAGQRGPEPESEPGPAALPVSFYELIERQMRELRLQGKTALEAEARVAQDIAIHFRDFLGQVRHRHQTQRQELAKLVGPSLLRAVERAVSWAESRLNRALPERILYALALHIHSSLQRVEQGLSLDYPVGLPRDDTAEAQAAAGVVELLSRELGRPLPSGDVALVTMLLRPEQEEEARTEQVGVVVMAHGRVATPMAEVAHALTGTTLAQALDMPLDEDPAAAREQLVQLVQAGRFPGGLLLLVDMGSLESIGEEVSERTGLQVRTVGTVSTPLVVEAVHQAAIPGATVDQVYQAVLTSRSLLFGRDGSAGLPQVILTFCFTGVGSAQTLAKIVSETLAEQARRVDVIPASINAGAGWTRLVTTLLQSHRLLALVGPVNPSIPGVPYISTEEVVVGSGARRLRRLVEEGTTARERERPTAATPVSPDAVLEQMAFSLGEHLKVTNPAATIPVIARGLTTIEQYLAIPMTDELRIGLAMHLACLVDRKVQDRLRQEPANPAAANDAPVGSQLPWLKESLRDLTDLFHIRFTADELARLEEILTSSVSANR